MAETRSGVSVSPTRASCQWRVNIAVTGMIPDGDYRLFRPLQQQRRKAHRTYQYTLSNKQTGIPLPPSFRPFTTVRSFVIP
jgi:hypothetical protein